MSYDRTTAIQPEATLTIKEMAAQSGMSEYTLLYYEKIGLIKLIPRDGSSGHRRYSTDTAQRWETLACLRAVAFPPTTCGSIYGCENVVAQPPLSKKRCSRHTSKKCGRDPSA